MERLWQAAKGVVEKWEIDAEDSFISGEQIRKTLEQHIADALTREREAALEEAAKVCDNRETEANKLYRATYEPYQEGACDEADMCAYAIRALKSVGVNQAAG